MACTESLNERIICSGWKAAGLVPWNPSRALTSSQVIGWPTTAPRQAPEPAVETALALQTPLSQHHLYIMLQQLQQDQGLNRNTRMLLSKAGKALTQAISKQVEKEIVIKQLRAQLEASKPQRPRKRVRIDPNRRFAEMEEIRAAQLEATHAQIHKDAQQAIIAARNIAVKKPESDILDTIVVQLL